MAEITKELGRIPVSRGDYQASTEYYKDNIVQYKRGSYQVVSESPIIGVSPTNDNNIVNPGWTLFAGTLDAQDVVNQIKEQEAQSIQAVAAREAEILAKSDASKISSSAIGLEGSNVEDKLTNASHKLSELETKVIYDVSAHNDGAVFESLSALLSSSSLDTLIPTSARRGGMTIKFIQGSGQSSDNKYVQYRLMANTFSTTESDWQGVDATPIADSKNLVESGGVYNEISKLSKDVASKTGGEITVAFPKERGSGYFDRNGEFTQHSAFNYAYIDIRWAAQCMISTPNLSDPYILNIVDANKVFIRNILDWDKIRESYTINSFFEGDAYLCLSVQKTEDDKFSFSISYNGEINENIEGIDKKIEGSVLSIQADNAVIIERGYYYNETGEKIASVGNSTAFESLKDYNKVDIILKSVETDSCVINLFDKNKDFVRNIYEWNSESISIPNIKENEYYIGVSCLSLDLGKVEIKKYDYGVKNKTSNLDVDIYGGVNTGCIAEFFLTDGFQDRNGGHQEHSHYQQSLLPIKNAISIILHGDNVTQESVVINMLNAQQGFIKNIVDWYSLTKLLITDIPQEAYYLMVSYLKTDKEKIYYQVEIKGLIEQNVVVNDLMGGGQRDSLGAQQGKVISDYMLQYDSAFAYSRNNARFIKGLFLDAGRKYFNPANIKTLILEASQAGLNTFILYFSDNNGFRFGLNDMTINANGKTYDLSLALGDGMSPTDGTDKWLTQSEMDDIIVYSGTLGINFIPAFDMPGHTGALQTTFNLWVKTEQGRSFYLAVLKKYVDYFAAKGCAFFNICGDESQLAMSTYASFMQRALRVITSAGLVPLIYNDEICKNGSANPYLNTGALVLGWSSQTGMATYPTIRKSGYKMINANGSVYYWTLGHTTTTEQLITKIRNSDIFVMADGSRDTGIVGAIYHIWCDQADANGADEGDNVVAQTAECINAFGDAVNAALPDSCLVVSSVGGSRYKIEIGEGGTMNATLL